MFNRRLFDEACLLMFVMGCFLHFSLINYNFSKNLNFSSVFENFPEKSLFSTQFLLQRTRRSKRRRDNAGIMSVGDFVAIYVIVYSCMTERRVYLVNVIPSFFYNLLVTTVVAWALPPFNRLTFSFASAALFGHHVGSRSRLVKKETR